VSFNYIPRTAFILVFLCACAASLNAQDSTRYVKPSARFITEQDLDRNDDYHQIDTGFNRVEIFQHPFKKYILFQDLGNFGSASRPLLFNINRNTGFYYAQNPYDVYFFKSEETRYINTKTPYTDIFYSQGPEELLFLKLKHTQNIKPRWNIGVDYQRVTSLGYIDRQHTSLYNIQAFTSFYSKNKRYHLLASATWNRVKNEENGGIASDSAFEILTGKSKSTDVRLTAAESYVRNRSIHIKQYWNFGAAKYQYREEDTLYDFQNRSHLAYTFHAEQMSYAFSNKGLSDTSLIPHQYYQTGDETYDSAYYGKMENKLELHFFSDRETILQDSIRRFLGASITHQQIAVEQSSQFFRNYQNIIADITLESNALKNNTLSYAATGTYTVAGFNSGDMKATALARYRSRLFDLSANGLIQLYKPDFSMLLFKTNQFIWNNNFDQTGVTQLGGTLATRSFKNNFVISANQYAVNNWVYVSTDGTPRQQSQSIFVTTATLSKTFRAWKFFFEHELIYQKSNSDVIRVPEFGGMARYYFASRLFKALTFQLGVTAYYNTAYYGNAYNPATRLFYLQNDVKIGNYPVIDPYFIGEIKQAAFFVKMEHLNQDWNNKGFYYTPHYPLSLQSLRLGLRWRFYN
jgi:hypothetical protein